MGPIFLDDRVGVNRGGCRISGGTVSPGRWPPGWSPAPASSPAWRLVSRQGRDHLPRQPPRRV